MQWHTFCSIISGKVQNAAAGETFACGKTYTALLLSRKDSCGDGALSPESNLWALKQHHGERAPKLQAPPGPPSSSQLSRPVVFSVGSRRVHCAGSPAHAALDHARMAPWITRAWRLESSSFLSSSSSSSHLLRRPFCRPLPAGRPACGGCGVLGDRSPRA